MIELKKECVDGRKLMEEEEGYVNRKFALIIAVEMAQFPSTNYYHYGALMLAFLKGSINLSMAHLKCFKLFSFMLHTHAMTIQSRMDQWGEVEI